MNKRIIVILFTVFSICMKAQVEIDGKQAMFDSKTNTALATIPKSVFGSDYQTTVNGKTYTFNKIEGGKVYSVDDLNITFTFLPILHLEGQFGYEYEQAVVSLLMPDESDIIGLSGKIKWRGGTTNAADKHKRNYKIKLNEDQQFFGLRKDNKWILDAGQADLFRVRNRIATEIWNDMSQKPYYANKEPDVLTGVRGKLIEVFLNDEYRGIYCLTECMDRKQLKLKKFDKETGEIHGGLWKSKGYGSSLMWECPDTYDNQSETWDVFEAKYPELDDLEETDYSTLYNAINFVANSSDEDFCEHIREYFDIPTIIDYYIFLETLNAFDNVGKNMYWAVYDKVQDKKLTPAVWDLDATVGAKWLGEWSVPNFEININMNLIVRLLELNVDNFKEKALQRYHSLRENILSTINLKERYIDYYNNIHLSGADKREENLWSKDTDIAGEILDFENEIDFILEWITQHMQYLDEHQFKQVNTHIDNINIKDNKTYYNLYGQKINISNGANVRVYINNGKKYVH